MRLTGLTLPILLGALLIQVVTAGAKPGLCPPCHNPCTENPKMDCDSDKNCNGTQKCCEDGCVYSCKDPVVIKPGECPVSSTPDALCPSVIPMEDRHCTGDQDCNGTQKCCKDGCGYSCKNPKGTKPGECPTCLNPCTENPKMDCDSDENCNGTQKCCRDGCQFSCRDPVGTNRGECPVFPIPCSGFAVGPICNGDKDCDGIQKCCQDGSHFTCTDPVVTKPGECPRSSIPACLCPDVIPKEDCHCDGDQNCNGTKKCCLYNCQYLCKDPAGYWLHWVSRNPWGRFYLVPRVSA